jgi:hypothetical protein
MQKKTVAKRHAGISRFMKDERGDFGVSQIAMIVVGVVIIGIIFLSVKERLPDLFNSFWGSIEGWLEGMTAIGK